MTVLSNIITPSNVLTTTNTATVTNKTLTSPTVTGMTVSDGTANGVTYLNGSKVLTSGSALTFDGASLGIGTTSPIRRLTVSNSGAEGLEIGPGAANGDTAGAVTSIYYNRSGSAYVNAIQSASNFIYQISGSEGMRLTSTSLYTASGINVGIGTSSPSEKLQVVGKILATGDARIGVKKAGSDSVGAGPFFSLQNADASREWFNQLGASNSLDWWYYNGSSYTKQATLDSAGNLGLGVTPSAWTGNRKVIAIGGTVSALNYASLYGENAYNCYTNGTNYLYQNTGYAGEFNFHLDTAGGFSWKLAASGTAGNAITFTQAMTLGSDGNLLVGNTSQSGTANRTAVFSANKFGLSIIDTTAQATGVGGALNLGGNYRTTGDAQAFARVAAVKQNSTDNDYAYGIAFSVTPNGGSFTEAGRFDSSGNLLVGTTNTNPGGADINGIALRPGNFSVISALGATPLGINRGTDDGTLISFAQAGNTEGSISVSGTTVSYNGGHLSRYAQTTTAKDNSLVKGTVLSNLDAMNTYTDAEGNPVDNEQLNKVKVSDTEGDVNVAGVFVNWSHDEQHNIDEINMAMTGDMIIRIAQGVAVVRGDLLMSAGDGTAKPQGDDIVRSKTVAKVTSNHVTCTYADGSYCVPCVLMAC